MVFTIQDRNTAAVPGTQSKIHTTDLAILLAGFSGTGVVSGCGVTAQGSPDMTVAVAAGTILAAGVQVAVTSGNLTVGTADGTNPRIDLISASAAGVKTITAGTAAPVATCKPPDLPSGHVGLAFVDVPAADTTIGSAQITDKSVVLPASAQAASYKRTAGDYTTTSATMVAVDATNMALTIVTGATRCLIGLVGSVYHSGTDGISLDVDIDGTLQGRAVVSGLGGLVICRNPTASREMNASFAYLTPVLSPGSHTFTLMWCRPTGTATLEGGSASSATSEFYVVEQPT